MTIETQVITSGKNQAVRIPSEMRLPSKQVRIVETPAGLLIIDPVRLAQARTALAGIREPVKKRQTAGKSKRSASR